VAARKKSGGKKYESARKLPDSEEKKGVGGGGIRGRKWRGAVGKGRVAQASHLNVEGRSANNSAIFETWENHKILLGEKGSRITFKTRDKKREGGKKKRVVLRDQRAPQA